MPPPSRIFVQLAEVEKRFGISGEVSNLGARDGSLNDKWGEPSRAPSAYWSQNLGDTHEQSRMLVAGTTEATVAIQRPQVANPTPIVRPTPASTLTPEKESSPSWSERSTALVRAVSADLKIVAVAIVIVVAGILIYAWQPTPASNAPPYRAWAAKASNGARITLAAAGRERQTVVLAGVIVPNIDQPGGEAANEYLRSLIGGRDLVAQTVGTDSAESVAVYLRLDGRDVSRGMVAAGHACNAWAGLKSDPAIPFLDIYARTRGLGMWSSVNRMPPWNCPPTAAP